MLTEEDDDLVIVPIENMTDAELLNKTEEYERMGRRRDPTCG
jgi:hypothetical protein